MKYFTVLFFCCFTTNSFICARSKKRCPHSSTKDCDVLVDCSRKKLTEIPKFVTNVTCIFLRENKISLIAYSSFQGLHRLHTLDLSGNILKTIHEGAFGGLKMLQYLDISYNNNLGFAVLPNVTHNLNKTNIKVLKFDQITCMGGRGTVLRQHHLHNLKNTSLEELSTSSNRIDLFEPCVLSHLPKTMKKMSFAANRFSAGMYAFEFHTLENVQVINASLRNRPPHFYESVSSCRENFDKEEFTPLRKTCLQSVKSNTKPSHHFNVTYSVPPNLHTLYLNSSRIFFRATAFGIHENKIRRLFLQDNIIYQFIGPLFGVENITEIDLSRNFCYKMTKSFTHSLPKLRILKLKQNNLGETFKSDISGSIFEKQSKLYYLDISYNRIHGLSFLFLKNLVSLSLLDISNNQISEWNVKMSHMMNLSYLDLSNNRLGAISKNGMKEITQLFGDSNLTINLKGNRLICSCDTIDFLRWFSKYREHFRNYSSYSCSKTHKDLFSFKDLEKSLIRLQSECQSNTFYYVLGSTTLSLLLSFVISVSIYKNRWKIRYLRYTAKQRFCNRYIRLNNKTDDPFMYDAFVSYASKDREFVTKEMIKHLEQINGFRLLIRDRSFVPGDSKSHQIVRSIQESKRTICVVSKRFLKSSWREYELNMARVEGIEARKTLRYVILILLPEVQNSDYLKKISDFLKKNCFIEYPDDPAGYKEFWQNLCDNLRENIET
ncbi:toll-like receptor 4 [Saccostrea echinata]|uniref:toll-like receptor 4 n=1 Tax=Saccostrea echinata TaxID=191078 RepID=UPI002A7FC051|nr:toll-like receptor 4 [Saccostrea echinata]